MIDLSRVARLAPFPFTNRVYDTRGPGLVGFWPTKKVPRIVVRIAPEVVERIQTLLEEPKGSKTDFMTFTTKQQTDGSRWVLRSWVKGYYDLFQIWPNGRQRQITLLDEAGFTQLSKGPYPSMRKGWETDFAKRTRQDLSQQVHRFILHELQAADIENRYPWNHPPGQSDAATQTKPSRPIIPGLYARTKRTALFHDWPKRIVPIHRDMVEKLEELLASPEHAASNFQVIETKPNPQDGTYWEITGMGKGWYYLYKVAPNGTRDGIQLASKRHERFVNANKGLNIGYARKLRLEKTQEVDTLLRGLQAGDIAKRYSMLDDLPEPKAAEVGSH